MITRVNSKKMNMRMQKRTSKSQNVWEESKKMQIFFLEHVWAYMTTNLKASRYKKGLTYLKKRIATNKKKYNRFTKDKKKRTKHNTKGKREQKYKVNGKKRFKMEINTPLLFSH